MENVQSDLDVFNEWFKGSQVVDDNNLPLVMYHGTNAEIKEFNIPSYFTANRKEASAYTFPTNYARIDKLRNKYNAVVYGNKDIPEELPYMGIIGDIPASKRGELYATDQGIVKVNQDGVIDVYSDLVVDYESKSSSHERIVIKKGLSNALEDLREATEEFIARRFPDTGKGGNVIPVYSSIKNPKELSPFEANIYAKRLNENYQEDWDELLKKLEAQGYDGIKTSSDEAAFFPELAGEEATQYIPFYSHQIKSAIEHNYDFSIENNNSLAVDKKKNQQALIQKILSKENQVKECGYQGTEYV